ncbi:MAG: hypothetical protein H6563_13990 [Lewinellaceae bacterium]|nr:hypothetical protein [Lewinellaceae bacterium]
MAKTVLVPMHLDALFVSSTNGVETIPPLVDFTRLEACTGDTPTNVYLGENLSTAPLNNAQGSDILGAGFHLHWALPDALTKTMGQPFTRQQPFLNIFGKPAGEKIWTALQKAGWISDSQPTAKVLKLPKERRTAPDGITEDQLQSVNDLLNHPSFPAVPNRWLVSRFPTDSGTPDVQWVVESDYVWPQKTGNDNHGSPLAGNYTAWPFPGANALDYRFIGCWYKVGESAPPGGTYLSEPLTAVGYGEPTFAALYPNCRTVFGFWDKDYSTPCTYEVRGWYFDPKQDYWASFITDFLAKPPDKYPYARLLEALKEEFQWFIPIQVDRNALKLTIDNQDWFLILKDRGWVDEQGLLNMAALHPSNTLGPGNEVQEADIRNMLDDLIGKQLLDFQTPKQGLPTQTLYYARCVADPKKNQTQPPADTPVTFAVGNTSTEAMSAFLANLITPGNKKIVEDYLEAQLLSASLQQPTDLGPKFEEARHQKGFEALPGGTIWTIRAQSSTYNKASKTKAGDEITLPDSLADSLNSLNNLQQKIDQTNFEIESLQQQIFSNWCCYLKLEFDVKNAPGQSIQLQDPNDPGEDMQDPNDLGEDTQDPNDLGEDTQDPNDLPTGVDLPGALDSMKDLIHWEIETVLYKLNQQKQKSLTDLAAAQQQVAVGLARFEQENQYLQATDIQDWNAFEKAVKGMSIPAVQKISFSGLGNFDPAILEALNKALLNDADLYKKLQFTSAIPDEAKDLQKQQNTQNWTPAIYLRYNRLLLESLLPIAHRPRYIVQNTAAPRYWQPTEPTLLISGVQPTPRHGQDGRLRIDRLLACNVSDIDPPGLSTNPAIFDKLHTILEHIKGKEPGNFALHPQSNEWHPVLLEWEVDFSPALRGFTSTDPNTFQYKDTYIEDYYSLDLNAVDFSKTVPPVDASDSFSGRCVLTPSGSLLQKDIVVQNLVPAIMDAIKKELDPHRDQPMTPLSKKAFIDWVTKGEADDPVLKALVVQPTPVDRPDTPQIADWITDCLSDARSLPSKGIVSWYWQFLKKEYDEIPFPSPDSEGQPVVTFVNWVMDRMHLKKAYYKKYNIIEANQSDSNLQKDRQFPTWLGSTLGNSTLKLFFEDQKINQPEGDALSTYLQGHFNRVINWFYARMRGILHRVIDYYAYKNLHSVAGLSQALGGFNKALVNLSQTWQLDIADPLASDQSPNGITAKVRDAVQHQNRFSPIATGDYAPFRAGEMAITCAKLINTFGQQWQPVPQKMVCTEAMTSTRAQKVILPPRLAQPARLNFRWLSAHSSVPNADVDLEEMNSHPATSPICGWVLPNNLDNSLMVYHQNGQALGYIDPSGNWRVFPGHDGPVLPEDIDNPHLSNLVQRLCRVSRHQSDFIADFITVLDTAADSIAPDNNAQHQALSLLIGRPFALVRATLSLEQRGLSIPYKRSTATDPNFISELNRFSSLKKNGPVPSDGFQWNTYHYERVKVPLRLGEFRLLNDGMAGFWVDAAPAGVLPPDANLDTFFAPQSFDPDRQKHQQTAIKTHDEDGTSFLLNLTLDQKDPIQVSMLMDPRGKIHATCGLLPVKSIQIPPDQYKTALQNMEVAFLSAPLLTLPGRIHVSLPREPGFGWSWVQKEGKGWKVVNSVGAIRMSDVARIFPAQAGAVWAQLSEKGWILDILGDQARVAPIDQRIEGLDPEFTPLLPLIEEMLERTELNPFDTTAAFSGTPEIREGWLKLTKLNI